MHVSRSFVKHCVNEVRGMFVGEGTVGVYETKAITFITDFEDSFILELNPR